MNKIEQQVLNLIGENLTSPDVFKDNDDDLAPIRDSVNDAIQEIAMFSGGFTQKFHIPLVADKTFYRITFKHGYMGWVQDAWLVNQKRRLTQTGLSKLIIDPRWYTYTGTPEEYFIIGLDVLGFKPKPSASSDVIELTCVVIPEKYLTDKDRLKVRDTFQWSVINYAVSEYWAGRGDAKEAGKHIGMYLDNMGIKSIYSQNNKDFAMKTEKQNTEAPPVQ